MKPNAFNRDKKEGKKITTFCEILGNKVSHLKFKFFLQILFRIVLNENQAKSIMHIKYYIKSIICLIRHQHREKLLEIYLKIMKEYYIFILETNFTLNI